MWRWEIRSKFVHIADGVVTQQDLVRVIEKAMGGKWARNSVLVAEGFKDAGVAIGSRTVRMKEFLRRWGRHFLVG